MRVTSNSEFLSTMASIERAAAELAKVQGQVSSGRRVNAPSDDPAAANRAIVERADIGAIDRYVRTAQSAASRLAAVDSVVSDIVERLTAARASASVAIGTVATASQREAAAKELEAIADALLSDVNTSLRGTYVFSGAAVLGAPYVRLADGTVSAYQGSADTVSVDIDAQRSVRVAFDAREITVGADAEDVFTCISGLVTAIRSNDQAAICAGIDGVGRALDRAIAFQTAIGTDLANISDETQRMGALRRAAMTRVSQDEDANMTEAVAKMARADTAYEAALAALGTRSRQTLLDYL